MRFLSLALVFLLCSCATQRLTMPPPKRAPSGLYQCRVEQEGKVRLNGLLALQRRTGALEYNLMDAAGLTLVAGLLPVTGDAPEPRGLLAGKGQAEFLQTALQRTLLVEPVRLPCAGVLSTTCKAGEGKRNALLGVTRWRVAPCGDGLCYTVPFAGVRVSFEPVEGGNAGVEN